MERIQWLLFKNLRLGLHMLTKGRIEEEKSKKFGLKRVANDKGYLHTIIEMPDIYT